MKCLVVDDVEDNQLVLSALLSGSGVEILCASSGREALELLLEHDVALALLDVQMPEMDGFELAEIMRSTERTRQVPIIFVTAGAREQHRMFQGYELGAVDFLFKPIEPHILQSKVNVFLQLYRQRQELAEQLQQLTQTLHMNEMFTAILSHDLRNPLNAVLAGAEVLLRTVPDEMGRKVAERIRSSGLRMSGLVNDTLDLARARVGGGIVLDVQPMDLGEVTQRVVAEHELNPRGSRVSAELHGDLRGHWDSARLAQVVSNLIGNALEHGAAGEPVLVAVNGDEPHVVTIRVSNVGTVPASVRARIFDPFGSRERISTKSGLGLGLYIVQQVVLAHGGTVELEADDGVRTTFRLELPRRRDAASPRE
jgi:two-component system, sensor histidine kinase and response regulator